MATARATLPPGAIEEPSGVLARPILREQAGVVRRAIRACSEPSASIVSTPRDDRLLDHPHGLASLQGRRRTSTVAIRLQDVGSRMAVRTRRRRGGSSTSWSRSAVDAGSSLVSLRPGDDALDIMGYGLPAYGPASCSFSRTAKRQTKARTRSRAGAVDRASGSRILGEDDDVAAGEGRIGEPAPRVRHEGQVSRPRHSRPSEDEQVRSKRRYPCRPSTVSSKDATDLSCDGHAAAKGSDVSVRPRRVAGAGRIAPARASTASLTDGDSRSVTPCAGAAGGTPPGVPCMWRKAVPKCDCEENPQA